MSSRITRGSVRSAVEDLAGDDSDGADAGDASVLWNVADPTARPNGATWVPEARTLTFDLWSAQREALDSLRGDADITGFLAGYGSGKTVFGARWLLKQALDNPGSRFLAMGIDFTKARDTTFRVLFEQLPGDRTAMVTSSFNGPETSAVVADYNRQEHRLTLTNDAVIKLGSADRWNRYAGDSYGGVWLDEPSHYGEDLHDLLEMIGSRLRGVAGPKTQLWTLTGNGYNAAFEILEKHADSDGEEIGLNINTVRASTLENPYLDAGEKERFERQYGGTSREEQALHGGFAAAQGLVYSNFSRDTHVIPHAEATDRIDDQWRIYGYDAGWNDPRALVEIGRTPYNQLVVVDEYYQSESHVSDVIQWLEHHDKPKGPIYCEWVPGEIEKLEAAGWPATKATKELDSGIAEVRKRLEGDGNMSVPTDDSLTDEQGRLTRPPGKDTVVRRKPASTGLVRRNVRSSNKSNGQVRKSLTSSTTSGTPSRRNSRSNDDDSDDSDATGSDTTGERSGERYGLLISKQCENTIREFLGYKEEHVGKSVAEDHLLDATRYCIRGITE